MADFARALDQGVAREGRPFRRTDELRRIRHFELQQQQEHECHCLITFWRFSWRMSVDIGPAYFAAITPFASMKNVSGTPPTP